MDSGTRAERLIVFTRYPHPGKVKTRLIPSLGAYGAARLQREMTRAILRSASTLAPDIGLEVHFDQGDESGMQHLYGSDLTLRRQTDGDLGQRMRHAFESAFAEGAGRVVLIGSDCPLITPAILCQAFDRLASYACVLGPAADGGYYLIGLTRPEAALFEELAWGTPSVLAQTLSRAQGAGLATSIMQTLPDIDRPEDVTFWKAALDLTPPRIAVIIPTLNEAASIAQTLKSLESGRGVEVIVADGGSTDETTRLAAAHGAVVIQADKGRARQCNAGAAHACADILFFLHADTRVSPGYDHAIRTALADSRTAAGAFSLGFDAGGFGLGTIALGANIRSRILKRPYGDQGIFLWAADFKDAGGFPDLPLMDDALFMARLKRRGRIVTVAPKVITSSRRYDRLGILPTWLINQCVLIGLHLGAGPDELARLYRTQADLSAWIKLIVRSAVRRANLKHRGKRL